MTSPLMTALGYGWRCPYCHIAQDEGQQTGVYYFRNAVCVKCAKILIALRQAHKDSE